MAVCAFSMIGLPLPHGFFGKLISSPGVHRGLYLAGRDFMIHAAISAAYTTCGSWGRCSCAEGSGDDAVEMNPSPCPRCRLSIARLAFSRVFGTVIFGDDHPRDAGCGEPRNRRRPDRATGPRRGAPTPKPTATA